MSLQPRLCLQFTDPCADLLRFKSSPTTKATKELVPVQLGNTLNITYSYVWYMVYRVHVRIISSCL